MYMAICKKNQKDADTDTIFMYHGKGISQHLFQRDAGTQKWYPCPDAKKLYRESPKDWKDLGFWRVRIVTAAKYFLM